MFKPEEIATVLTLLYVSDFQLSGMMYESHLDYCSDAKKRIQKYYVELSNLPINSILGQLYAKEVITHREKKKIETIQMDDKRIEYLLDDIIIPSLTNNVTVKLERFLKVMKEMGDPVLIDMAKKIGMYSIYSYTVKKMK